MNPANLVFLFFFNCVNLIQAHIKCNDLFLTSSMVGLTPKDNFAVVAGVLQSDAIVLDQIVYTSRYINIRSRF